MHTTSTFRNGTQVTVGPSWSVVTLPSGHQVHAHPQGSGDQAGTARSLGYGDDVAAMTRDHDLLHVGLTDWLGLPASISLSQAAGLTVNPALAALEEEAVLAVQRFAVAAGANVQGLSPADLG